MAKGKLKFNQNGECYCTYIHCSNIGNNVGDSEFPEKTKDDTSLYITESGWTELESGSSKEEDNFDGGWGWFIVIGSMLVHFIVAGLNRAAGILYLRFEEKFNEPAAITAWVTSLSVSLTLAVGPIASALCNRFSYRIVVVSGGLILAASMIVSGLSPNLYILFLSYGVLGGIGKAFAYGPGVVIVGLYFNRKRGVAVGLATSGVAIGAFVIPSVVEMAFVEYSYIGAFIIMTGISLQLIVCGFLFRPLALHKRITKFKKREVNMTKVSTNVSVDQTIGTDQHDVFSVHQRLQLKDTVISKNKYIKDGGNISKEDVEPNNTNMFKCSLLRNIRFNGFCIAILLFNFAFQSAMIFLPTFSAKFGIEHFEAFPVVIIGIFDGLGRIISGFLFDRKCIKPYRCLIYNASLCCLGFVSITFPYIKDVIQLGSVCAVYGLFLGTGISQQSVIIIDILGADNLSYGFGILLLYQGIGTFVGPPLSGLLKDINGTYNYAFYVGGIAAVVGAFILLIATKLDQKQKLNNYEVKSNTMKYIVETHF